MRIGLDFDNTIVSYDALFHKIACEQGLIPEHIPVNKVAVRDCLRATDREPVWTEMQGLVYGKRMDEAAAYPGVVSFLQWAQGSGHDVAIISHKTRHPFLGPKYDLHEAARAWVNHHLSLNGEHLIPESQVFYEVTKEDKLNRIGYFGCDYFLDDLPEILGASMFPDQTKGVLFDPELNHQCLAENDSVKAVRSWGEFMSMLQAVSCEP